MRGGERDMRGDQLTILLSNMRLPSCTMLRDVLTSFIEGNGDVPGTHVT
jgi:hypothetical protein